MAGLPNDSPVKNVEYTGETPHIYSVGSGSVAAKIGYRAPCVWAPIFTCDTDLGSTKTVSTSHINGVDFIGYTQENNSWVTPYYKMSPAVLFKTYTGVTIFITQQPGHGPQNGV